jgi:hypothetical protein
MFGVDRYILGYPMLGTLKLMSFGGLGFWWIADIVAIAVGGLRPQMYRYTASY